MWIGLMPDVPGHAVMSRIEHIAQGYRQLDRSQSGGEVSSSCAHAVNEELAQLGCERG
jgi:hypothetical protein